MKKINHAFLWCFVIVSAMAIQGCTHIDFREPVSNYSKGMSLSAAVLSNYYLDLNDQARDNFMIQAVYDKNISIDEIDKNGNPTPLVAFFSPDAIKARVDAISLINQFGVKLAALAGSNAPERLGTGIVDIGATYKSLSGRFDSLAKDTSVSGSSNYVEPISKIVSLISEQYMDSRRNAMLTKYVKEGYPEVEKILSLMEGDIPMMHKAAINRMSNKLSRATTYYNENRYTMTQLERSELLKTIGQYGKNYQGLTVNSPTDVVIAMREVNLALFKYAENPRDENRLVRLTAEIDTFNSRIAPIADAIEKIRSI